jgi:16S rRNA (uracil1498-N3)-methyltransferase
MPKFFAADCDLHEEHITLRGSNAEHLRVLRVREGEELTVADGRGLEARCAVELSDKNGCHLRVLELHPMTGEATVSAVLYAALPKGDKTEVIVQKAVELGADGIVFFLSSRCVARPDEKAIRGKLERLQRIAEGAAMQSGRGRIPEVRWIPKYEEMLAEASRAGLPAFLWEEETSRSLRLLMKERRPFSDAALITGPEGGFSAEEAKKAFDAGIPSVTLGKRILRCETAPLCALTAVMYETGNLD